MIRTWIGDVTSLLEEEQYKQYYEKVPAFRREKADKLRFQEDKALSVGAWTLLEMMREAYGLGEEAVFNLSHSGSLAMCSIEDGQDLKVKVGCDVEQIKKPHLNIAKRFFSKNECRYIEKEEQHFYRFWVLKESFMKATRLGMKLGLNTFEFDFTEEDVPILVLKPEEIEGTFYFKEYQVEGLPYCMAVCSTSNQFAEEVQMVRL